jgi:hypothetical protein
MSLEHVIRILAGTLVLLSIGLGYWIHEGWFLLTAFVGVNLIQSAFTKWCLAESIIRRLFYTSNPQTANK